MMDLDSREHFFNDLYSDLIEQENHRQYEAAMQRQAYIEAVERRRQQKILEEQRREYFKELELERERFKLEQEKQKRQYLALLEQKRLQQKRKEKLRAAACEEARKRYTNLRRSARHRSNPMQQFVQTPDGTIYRVQPTNVYNKEYPLSEDNLPNLHHQNSLGANMIPTPSSTRNVLFKKSSSVDQSRESDVLEVQPDKEPNPEKGSKFLQKKQLKSSVLIGDVEDASDSECEEDFHDYWHNRRPQSGKWIEPIEGATTHF